MIAPCNETHLPALFAIINDAARAYRGHEPADCLHEPYMSEAELRAEIAAGVRFFGWFEDGELLGVMGIQDVQDMTLIRHAYVATRARRGGCLSQVLVACDHHVRRRDTAGELARRVEKPPAP